MKTMKHTRKPVYEVRAGDHIKIGEQMYEVLRDAQRARHRGYWILTLSEPRGATSQHGDNMIDVWTETTE